MPENMANIIKKYGIRVPECRVLAEMNCELTMTFLTSMFQKKAFRYLLNQSRNQNHVHVYLVICSMESRNISLINVNERILQIGPIVGPRSVFLVWCMLISEIMYPYN
jgi:hypothetical protein